MVTEADILLLKSRINELEDRLHFLYRRLNIDYAGANSNPALTPQIQDAMQRGNKIEAIKIYRELTDVGLAEAKQAIERAEPFIKWELFPFFRLLPKNIHLFERQIG